MLAGDEREYLLQIADRLCAELGYDPGERRRPAAPTRPDTRGAGMSGVLGDEDESLVAAMRQGLAKVASALSAAHPGADDEAVDAALDGVELVIRGALVSGDGHRLLSMMPSFVFLIALPIVEQDEALDLSRRTSRLVDAT